MFFAGLTVVAIAVQLRLSEGLLWLSFPLVWIVYTIIRGAPA